MPLLDAYWEAHPVQEVRFAHEAARFIAWLETRCLYPGTQYIIENLHVLD